MLKKQLTPHIQVEDNNFYGYGIWIEKRDKEIFKFHVMGYDPGVSFASAYFPSIDTKIVIPSNKSYGPHDVLALFEKTI